MKAYPKPKQSNTDVIFDELMDYLKMIALIVVVVFVLNEFVIINARIPSESMENTIMVGDQVIGNRLAYKFNEPQRYDIVIFRYPDDKSQYFIKRIIGLPGETIEIKEGKVYINGSDTPLDDSFCPETPSNRGDTENGEAFVVPDGCYFMLGDNRNVSKDSRYWANPYVVEEDILGKAVLRYWPISDFGLIE